MIYCTCVINLLHLTKPFVAGFSCFATILSYISLKPHPVLVVQYLGLFISQLKKPLGWEVTRFRDHKNKSGCPDSTCSNCGRPGWMRENLPRHRTIGPPRLLPNATGTASRAVAQAHCGAFSTLAAAATARERHASSASNMKPTSLVLSFRPSGLFNFVARGHDHVNSHDYCLEQSEWSEKKTKNIIVSFEPVVQAEPGGGPKSWPT